MNVNESNRRNTNASHDVERGDEIVVAGVRDSRQPMTVRVVYHDGAIKAIDQFKGRYAVSAGDVADRVEVVNDDTIGCEECGAEYPDRPPVLVDGEEIDLCHDCYIAGVGDVEDEETLSDYFEIAEILAPNDKPCESDRFSDGRIEIEDRGKWNWSLSVTADGVVRAAKAIPYDGVLAYSTADRASSARRRSQHRLDVEQVVGRFRRHSETEMAEQELRVRIQEALSEVRDD